MPSVPLLWAGQPECDSAVRPVIAETRHQLPKGNRVSNATSVRQMTNTAKEYYSLVEIKMRWPFLNHFFYLSP